MRLYTLLLIVLIFCRSAIAEINEQSTVLKANIPPLFNNDNFVVYYVFADKNLEIPLKEIMIKDFQKIGAVYLGDDNKLTEKQKEDKYKTGGMIINVIATPIIEENSNSTSDYKKLPAIELSLKVSGGVEVLANGSLLPCTIWGKEKFVGTMSDKKTFVEKTVKAMDSILNAFIKDYKEANPTDKGEKPQFFLYS